jgi:membrane protease subunit HflC
MMGSSRLVLAAAAVLLVVVGALSIFTVDQRQRAVLLRLGNLVPKDFSPGLHFKIPLIDRVRKFDGRILTLDVEAENYLTREKKNLRVDAFVMWRINDVAKYYTSMGGDEQSARIRLSQIIKDGLRGEFGKRTVQEVVSGERVQIMKVLGVDADRRAEDFGIQVVDVRIKRIDLPAEVSQSVYRRMEAERARTAKELRSRGAEAAERIRADADRQRTVILAEAYRDAERLRGEGDAKATDTYAKAYGQDPEFYAFYRSLGAYRSGISQGSLLVLDPKSDFFRYFNNPKGTR